MNAQKRCLIVVNKYWECDPVCWVLTNAYLNERCGVGLPLPRLINNPSYGPVQMQPPTPRLIYTAGCARVEIWCISDMLSKFPDKLRCWRELKAIGRGNMSRSSSENINA